ncbi:DUF4124 domain-containing protein [Colwellia sp. 12G3]|uniref:DUF4124 domain-containing protein n=1 Tax=Colwellia sp. 12G3 TaxID=2058299 RepID=UPI000C342A93|nr:DUF4124 domain-containing protein [Colwellia sp. 12G3]PKI14314.1 DUF4124 domain-containing protein [Colwellia sp. 12G3]
MKNLKLLGTILLVTSITLSFNSSAEIYTWTDENGKVHYSDKPVHDEKVTTVKLKENNNIANTVTQDNQWQQDYNKAKQDKAEQTQKEAKEARKNKGYCDNIKRQLAKIEHGGRIYVISPKGERSFQSEDQLKAEKKKYTKAYKKTCR